MNNSGVKNEVIVNRQLGRNILPALPAGKMDRMAAGQSSWLNRLVELWLMGIVILLPVKIINLPSNFEVVDIWILLSMPVLIVLYGLRRQRVINLAYALPIWLVMISSLLSTFNSPAPANSLTVMLKEIYLFVWFTAAAVFLSLLTAQELSRVLRVWGVVAVLHGLFMIAQFLSPELWKITNSLGGNVVEHEIYCPSSLFICGHAGCANKAALFQFLGFVPLVLAGFSKRVALTMGMVLFLSILITGSMGATLAFLSGVIVAVIAMAVVKKNLLVLIGYFVRALLVIVMFGGLFYAIISLNPRYKTHFERIIVGRFDKSSGSRFNLWQRGLGVLIDHNALFWGVGPENFRVLDPAQTDNQLHNDALAFLVERGLIGLLGLALFAGIALRRAFSLLWMVAREPERYRLEVVVFLGAIVAVMIESLTHQVFRTRELWLMLALQEAIYLGMITAKNGTPAKPVVNTQPQFQSRISAQR